MKIVLNWQETKELLLEALEMKGIVRMDPSVTDLILDADESGPLLVLSDEGRPTTPKTPIPPIR